MILKKILPVFLLFIACISKSQSPTQTIKGIVVDKDSRRPLAGATISLADDSLQQGVISKEKGEFILSNIPVGRHRIQCTYIGYENFITDNNIVNSARELELVIEMEPLYKLETALVIKAQRNPSYQSINFQLPVQDPLRRKKHSDMQPA